MFEISAIKMRFNIDSSELKTGSSSIKNPLEFRTQGIGRRPLTISHLGREAAVIKAATMCAGFIDLTVHPC